MFSQKIQDALNGQINRELYSAYVYQAMSAHASHEGLKGIANWFSVQMKEELFHAQKLYDFVLSRGGKVRLLAIESPPCDYADTLSIFQSALDHERELSEDINALMTLARNEVDHATEILMQWFVTEQVEEEDVARDLVDKLKLAGGHGEGLYLIDQELAARKPAPSLAG
ncbi:MAG: ferritin [Verrucomicrobia bacterium]|nr:ferritin [Verrucomicrobiota bacterium]